MARKKKTTKPARKRTEKQPTPADIDKTKSRIRAGEAWLKATPKNEVKAIKTRMREKLGSAAENFAKLGQEINDRSIEKYGRPAPLDLDALIREATRAGVPYDAIENNSFVTLLPYIEGYWQRMDDEVRNALLRRASTQRSDNPRSEEPYLGVIVEVGRITRGDRVERISPNETRLLQAMVASGAAGITPDDLAHGVWPKKMVSDPRKQLDNLTSQLAERLFNLRLEIKKSAGVWSLVAIP